ncbi:MAG: hypothetical protein M1817_006773 [Caeruleum heppii]|nr:MAG: hypothetical protein M1817_006773 [Caeruleum heppii]
MSVRVVARIRPLLKSEIEKDVIVEAAFVGDDDSHSPTLVRMPNPKNPSEDFSFQFNSVYDGQATQEQLFQNEVAPTLKHLFEGFDVTLFAYGVTGTGKTHTMRGGKRLADRGVIPRLLSGIYRRGRKLEKDSQGATTVEVAMSYYEIYNVRENDAKVRAGTVQLTMLLQDRVYDLFEPAEKRTMSGLQLRAEQNGKTVVVGLTERPCTSLKEFEHLYDEANVNRSTSATKLNAHSSRSHAILCVKLTVTNGDQSRVSTASAIDLAGSEDNRRTDNGKERLVESASINKSLFVLAQCVEAISKKQSRIPYRESKMTRILSLGQNNGLTIMILNLAPVRSYHLDTLSSLNFANRTKKIEVKEIENEPMFKGAPRAVPAFTGSSFQRQPLRPLANTNVPSLPITAPHPATKPTAKPAKAFSVYTDRNRSLGSRSSTSTATKTETTRPSDSFISRPAKAIRPNATPRNLPRQGTGQVSEKQIESLVERKVEEILAARALTDQTSQKSPGGADIPPELRRRLESLEQRIESKDDARSEGLNFLLMAKQHHVRGEEGSALRMYKLALPYFPGNEKLGAKIGALEEKMKGSREKPACPPEPVRVASLPAAPRTQGPGGETGLSRGRKRASPAREEEEEDDEYRAPSSPATEEEDDGFRYRPRARKGPSTQTLLRTKQPIMTACTSSTTNSTNDPSLSARPTPAVATSEPHPHSPRTCRLLSIINSRALPQIQGLRGVGAKKAERIVEELSDGLKIGDLEMLANVKGVGRRGVECMREGIML